MALINIGGRMPDGVKVHEFWVEEHKFICASGAAMRAEGQSKKIMGKLCLLSDALIMLPYEGLWLRVGEYVIGKMQDAILGDYADMAAWVERLGIADRHANYEKLEKILIWPRELIEPGCEVEVHAFLGMRRGASLKVRINGTALDFQMANEGYAPEGFASAQVFCSEMH